ncbi:MAG: hypothetical protein WDN46_10745 [Methylocella sp.]
MPRRIVSRQQKEAWLDRGTPYRYFDEVETCIVPTPMGGEMLAPAGEVTPAVTIKWPVLDTDCSFKGPSLGHGESRPAYRSRTLPVGRRRDA